MLPTSGGPRTHEHEKQVRSGGTASHRHMVSTDANGAKKSNIRQP
jgi:hypothetical protein